MLSSHDPGGSQATFGRVAILRCWKYAECAETKQISALQGVEEFMIEISNAQRPKAFQVKQKAVDHLVNV